MSQLEVSAAEELLRAIEQSRREMENTGGFDLRAIVAETAYDYWPHRAALVRARERAAQRPAESALSTIGDEERATLVTAIGRTQDALRPGAEGGALDLAAIVREGSREYWAERRRLQERERHLEGLVNLDMPALAAMTQMLREGERALATRRERRKPWRDVVYDAAAVAAPLLFVPPLLLFAAQGRFVLPAAGPIKSALALADRSFTLTAVLLLCSAGLLLFRGLRHPERSRRLLQSGGALVVSLVAAILGAAYIYGNRTTSRMESVQARLSPGLLLSLAQSDESGEVVLPTQVDRSIEVHTRRPSSTEAEICAQTPDANGQVCVELRPQSAKYSWVVNGRQIPRGMLTVGEITSYDPAKGTITLKSGDQVTTYPYAGRHLTAGFFGSRVAAAVGTDNTINNIVGLGRRRAPS